MMMDKPLPGTLHELLALGLQDVEKVEMEIRGGNKGLEIDMSNWHAVLEDLEGEYDRIVCSICMAGCVMREELGTEDDVDMMPDDFENEDRIKLDAINCLRTGDVSAAYEFLYEVNDYNRDENDEDICTVADRRIVEYCKDVVGFKKEIRELIGELKEAGI